jgi:hypothetical protein
LIRRSGVSYTAQVMPSEVERHRDLARAFWNGEPVPCPKHPGAALRGTFVQTTYADHLLLECPRGKETYSIPQRPRQKEFNPRQVEGLVVFVQQGDSIRCYRCQSKLEMDVDEDRTAGTARYTFTCVRCFSFGVWEGRPEEASIEAPTVAQPA